jgi:dipeptidyl aminopeptidase/acylaminoacyl peptidase
MSLERRLRESLRRPADGDLESEERAWHVIAAAAPAESAPRRRLAPVRLHTPATLGGIALVAALAVSPPGAAVSNWIGDGLGVGGSVRHEPASPTLRALPGGGALLVGSPGAGASIVHADGSRRRLGPYRDVSWSPNGLFVAATRGRQLLAVTPTGEPRWALTPSRGAASPRWAPSGLRIAYRSGDTLRVVAGDGSGDLELMRGAGTVAPAWRPGSADELAIADGRGRIALISAVTGKTLWRSKLRIATAGLAWSSDGQRLAALTPSAVNVLDGGGAAVERLRPRDAAVFTALGYSPAGRRLALVERTRAGDAIHIAHSAGSRRIFATAATLRDPLWSPDGRWLLVSSPAADQWLFLRTRRPHRVVAISDVAAQLDPGDHFPAVPRPSGWCCARR